MHMTKQLLISFLLKMKKNSKNDSNNDVNLQEPQDSDDNVTVYGDSFFLIINKTIMYVEIT